VRLSRGLYPRFVTLEFDMKTIQTLPRVLSMAAVALASVLLAGPAHAQSCGGDINDDGLVNSGDLATLLSNWGACAVSAPTISQVAPNSGPASGGTVIYIGGTNLNRATSVTVGGVAATVLAAYPTVIVATTPPSATGGAKTVAVTTPGGTASANNAFTYGAATPSWATLLEAAPDPVVVTSASLRAAIAASGFAWRVRDTATQIEMVLVPAGTYTMGCTASNTFGCAAAENPTRQVTITNAFYMGRYEGTQAQWTARMGSNPSNFQSASAQVPLAQVPSRPVETVSWTTVQGFLTATGMRLPTEAEWEYASRAGTTTAFNNGSSDDNTAVNIAWYNANALSQTRPVGGKAANGLGLHDMSGNVWEWVSDWYGAYPAGAQTNPTGPATGTNRVLRSGSWGYSANFMRSSYRGFNTPAFSGIDIGFRVARNP